MDELSYIQFSIMQDVPTIIKTADFQIITKPNKKGQSKKITIMIPYQMSESIYGKIQNKFKNKYGIYIKKMNGIVDFKSEGTVTTITIEMKSLLDLRKDKLNKITKNR